MAADKEVQVRFLVSVAGMDVSYHPGQVVALPAAEAAKWADGERAEYVAAEPAKKK